MGAHDREQERSSEDIVVICLSGRSGRCDDCGAELARGDLLRKENDRGLCLSCADFDHLEFLERGDAALTRRATKHSRLRAVVIRWSRSRKRYERQGILVEPEAIEKALEECLADEELRQERRKRDAQRRERLDVAFVSAFAEHVRERYPGCPPKTASRIAEHACTKHSGRVGRSAMAKAFAAEAIELAVQAHLRHEQTDYHLHLASGLERWEARELVAMEVALLLEDWSQKPESG